MHQLFGVLLVQHWPDGEQLLLPNSCLPGSLTFLGSRRQVLSPCGAPPPRELLVPGARGGAGQGRSTGGLALQGVC